MNDDFRQKLGQVLSDPEAMAKITAIAGSLTGSDTAASASSPPPESVPASAASLLGGAGLPLMPSDPRIALLSSLKPLVREEKREKLDTLTKAFALISLFNNGKGGK